MEKTLCGFAFVVVGRVCRTTAPSMLTRDALKPLKGSQSFNEITRAFRRTACQPPWNLPWRQNLRIYHKTLPRDRCSVG